MKFHEQVLLNITNGEDCFGINIERDGQYLIFEKWGFTFQEAVEYIEENYPYYFKRYGKYDPVDACVCDDAGEPIVTYDGKKWELW